MRLVKLVLAIALMCAVTSLRLEMTYVPFPAQMVAYSRAGSCPAGFAEYTTARGRYVVGTPASGTVEAIVGTALADLESRAVGQHTHVQDPHTHTQNSHNHTQNAHVHGISGMGNTLTVASATPDASVVDNTGSETLEDATATNNAATATNNAETATNQNAGSVAGTNLPFIQLRACEKQ